MNGLCLYQDYSREEAFRVFNPSGEFKRSSWRQSGIVSIKETPGDFVFFVTYGRSQGDYEYRDRVSRTGVLTWQSQPAQRLSTPQIQEFTQHDHKRNNIHLFVRNKSGLKYLYLGRLAYMNHDGEREQPVHFKWQILDWDPPARVLELLGIELGPDTPTSVQLVQTEPPPAPGSRSRAGVTSQIFRERRTNYLVEPEKIASLGLKGEQFVLAHERRKWAHRHDVDSIVIHTSQAGDGYGYDIESRAEEGEPLYIEVKTTTGGIATPFYITQNELRSSQANARHYVLYRLYDFDEQAGTAKFYILRGDLTQRLELEPTVYKAQPLAGSEQPRMDTYPIGSE